MWILTSFKNQNIFIMSFQPLELLKKNGVAERKNRVLHEMTRVMIRMHNIVIQFQVEAINTTCYTANGIFLRLEIKRHLINYGLGENLTSSILELLEVNAINLEMGRTQGSLLENLIKVFSQAILLVLKLIGCIIKIHKLFKNPLMQL